MSTADGLILAIANAISHDVYYKMIDPKAETAKRLLVARVLLVVIGFAGATIAAMEIQGILGSVIWAFDFAMSGLFFPLVLGVWWKRANKEGAIAGMALGLASGMGYLVWVRNGGSGFLGITQLTFGIFGSAVSLVAMVVVSLMTSAPNAATQKMVDNVRVPSGTNQAPIAQKPAENRSITSAAVSNASSVPEIDLAEDMIDVTPRSMDTNPEEAFSSRGAPELKPPVNDMINSAAELRPSLSNFGPREMTSEKALENRIADIEIRSNNDIDETDTISKINNDAIEAFTSNDVSLQQAVDLSA
jgi:hypothetical protein